LLWSLWRSSTEDSGPPEHEPATKMLQASGMVLRAAAYRSDVVPAAMAAEHTLGAQPVAKAEACRSGAAQAAMAAERRWDVPQVATAEARCVEPQRRGLHAGTAARTDLVVRLLHRDVTDLFEQARTSARARSPWREAASARDDLRLAEFLMWEACWPGAYPRFQGREFGSSNPPGNRDGAKSRAQCHQR
jgi:hypothetical protein